MRELTKSMMTFPWAISLLGVQQITNLVAPPPEGRIAGAAHAFDAVSQATEQQLDGWLKQTYKVGDGVQRGLIDLMMLRPPSIDSSTIMRMASEMQGGMLFQAAVKYVMPPVGWLDSFLVDRKDSPAVQQEFANKLHIITLVTQVHGQLGLDASETAPLTTLVDRAAEKFTSFPRLWAIEGLGNYIAERAWDRSGGADPQGLLTDPSTATLPAYSMTMLHAGIGMSFANRLLRNLDADAPAEQVRRTVARFAALCRGSSRKGYTGAALESLGLATRTLYPNLVPIIDRELPQVDPELTSYFWHGVGRAVYFDPMNMLPSFNAPWRAINKIVQDAPNEPAVLNALSGFCWAITVVNMRHPSVMEAFLRHHASRLAQDGAFANGMTSSLLMRYDTSPDDPYIQPFIYHDPAATDGGSPPTWKTMVTEPCERAIRERYPQLKQGPSLEELFHYVPRPA